MESKKAESISYADLRRWQKKLENAADEFEALAAYGCEHALAEQENRVTGNNALVIGMKDQIAELESQITSLESDLAEKDDYIRSLNSDLAAANARAETKKKD